MKLANRAVRFTVAIVLAWVMALAGGASYTAFAVETAHPTDLTVKQTWKLDPKAEKDPAFDSAVKYEIKAIDSETTDAAETPMPGGQVGGTYEFTLKGKDAEVKFPFNSKDKNAISFQRAGIYAYEVRSAVQGEHGDYTYDSEVFTVKVQALNSKDGVTLEKMVVVDSEGEKPKDVEFNHVFGKEYPPDPVTVDFLKVEKKIKGNPKKDSTFYFTLKALESSAMNAKKMPMPGKSETKVTGEGLCSFGKIKFTKAGSYTYEIREKAGSDKNYNYDSSVYRVTYQVYRQGAGLKADASIQRLLGSGKPWKAADAVVFTNKYKGGIAITGDTSKIMLWGIVLAAAVAALVVIMIRRRRRG